MKQELWMNGGDGDAMIMPLLKLIDHTHADNRLEINVKKKTTKEKSILK